MVPPDFRGVDPYEQGPQTDDLPGARPYPTRPYPTRPYPTRPYPTRPYPTRGFGASEPALRPYPTRPYPTRPYPTRPYPTRPYPTRGEDPGTGEARLDPREWSDDLSDLFLSRSALIRLGARVLIGEGQIPVPRVREDDQQLESPTYVEPITSHLTPGGLNVEDGARKPHARLHVNSLWPDHHELAWNVILPDARAERLAEQPEPAWAVKEDIAAALAERADRAFLQDAAAPFAGIDSAAGTVLMPPPGGWTADDATRALLSAVRVLPDASFKYAGWIFGPEMLDSIAPSTQGDRSWDSTLLLISDGEDGGTLRGYPFVVTKAAGEHVYFSSDWSEAWIGFDRRIVSADVSGDARFDTDETVIRTTSRHDFLLRRPELFAVA